jgi:hypothetical protein
MRPTPVMIPVNIAAFSQGLGLHPWPGLNSPIKKRNDKKFAPKLAAVYALPPRGAS